MTLWRTAMRAYRSRRIMGSRRRSFMNATIMNAMITANGSAAMIVTFCSDFRPLPSSPVTSSTAAIKPTSTPHTTATQRDGSGRPCCDSVPMTKDAESAPVMKKIEISRISTMLVIKGNGRFSSTPKSTSSGGSTVRPAPFICCSIAVVPKIANQTSEITAGTTMTTETN